MCYYNNELGKWLFKKERIDFDFSVVLLKEEEAQGYFWLADSIHSLNRLNAFLGLPVCHVQTSNHYLSHKFIETTHNSKSLQDGRLM